MGTFSEHLTKSAGKLKNRNNLLMQLAGSTKVVGYRLS